MVDGATGQWIPIVSGLSHGSVLGPLMFILYTNERFELVENRLYAYMLVIPHYCMAAIRKPADRPAGAASLNRDYG